mgnify:CR=1 FL=1
MKNIYIFGQILIHMKHILLFISLFIFFSSQSQISQKGLPLSFTQNINSEIENIEFEKPNMEQVIADDNTKEKDRYRYGVRVYTDININEHGTWTNLKDGHKIWQIKITIPDAIGLGLYYDEFWIPSNGKLYLYNENKSHLIGAFTSFNNHSSGVFATEVTAGENVILEYHQIGKSDKSVKLHINEICYAYRGFDFTNFESRRGGFGSSDNCEVNVNCSPEGDNWQAQSSSVAKISISAGGGFYMCTGNMLNNTTNDCTPYFLTADHCADGSSISNHNQWVFYFNFEASGCNNPGSSPSSNTMTGCSPVSGSNGVPATGTISGGSDFYLVELNNQPPANYGVYLAGFDISTAAASSGVSIHHPSGDIKKISTYTQALTSTTWSGPASLGTHWRVYWSATANGHGVTEGGSSGSPIFNSDGLVVGDLSGGSSYCTNTNGSDSYGKLSYSWTSNGSTTEEQLKPWLDPLNQLNQGGGLTTVDGIWCGTNLNVNFSANQTEFCGSSSATVIFTNQTSGNASSYNWQFPGGNPSLASGAGPHTITYSSTGSYAAILTAIDGNGNTSTEMKPGYINVINGNEINLVFLPDCYGEETSWELQNMAGNVLYSVSSGEYPGGSTANSMEPSPNSVSYNWCLPNGCYDFVIDDSWGDGLDGNASGNACTVDGDYNIYDPNNNLLASIIDIDFGNQETNNFCFTASNIENENNIINIYPNPTTGKVNINSNENLDYIKIYNMIGEEIISTSHKNQIKNLHIKNSGIYLIIISSKNKIHKEYITVIR